MIYLNPSANLTKKMRKESFSAIILLTLESGEGISPIKPKNFDKNHIYGN